MAATRSFKNQVHLLGRITVTIIVVAFIAVPFVLSSITGVSFDFATALQAATPLIVTFTTLGIIESVTYTPIIGAGASYVTFITGNAGNMKVPASITAMEITECPPATDRGDVIAIISVTVSSIVTMLILAATVFFLAPYLKPVYENEFLKPAFANMIPALMGAILVPVAAKFIKEAVVPVLIPAAIVLYVGAPNYGPIQSYVMGGVAVLAVITAWLLNKNKLATASDSE